MANFQRIFGDDGLPYLIDTSSERAGENYSSWNLGNENLELSLEPSPFARDRDMDPGYEPDTARFREFQTSYPELMRGMDRPEDFLRSNFLRTEKEDYQDGDFDHCNFNASRNQIGNERPQLLQDSASLKNAGEMKRRAGSTAVLNSSRSNNNASVGPWLPEHFFSRAGQLSRAAEWAYSHDERVASDAYQKEAHLMWYAGNAEKMRLLNLKADALFSDRNAKVPANPFYPGWNTGDYAAGFEQPGIPRPNYVAVSGGGLGLGGGASVNLDSGHAYNGASGGVPVTPGASVVWGYILGNGSPNDLKKRVDVTNNFLNGSSTQLGGSIFGIYGGINHAFGGDTAIELGFGTPGFNKKVKPAVNGNVGVTFPIGRLPYTGKYKD